MPDPLRIVFFGTPDYAVPALRALAGDARFRAELVVTQPDRPAGRGRKLTAPPVKLAAQSLGLPVHQPGSLRTEEARAPLARINADIFFVAAYGLIFGPKTLGIPRLGCVNLHASLLPAYRGASPISAAILHGDAVTGVTLMRMETGLDTGPMIATSTISIEPGDTTASLTEKLADIGASLAIDAIPKFANGELTPMLQPASGVSLVRPLLKSDGRLDWNRPAGELERLVRAMWPSPRAWFAIGANAIQVHAASVEMNTPGEPGTVDLRDGKIVVAASGGSLRLDLLQFPGGKPMTGHQAALSGRFVEGLRLASPQPAAHAVPMIRPVEPHSGERESTTN